MARHRTTVAQRSGKIGWSANSAKMRFPMHAFSILLCLAATASAADLTGNWVIAQPNTNDGTFRKTYLNLKQDGDRITGWIRTTQFYYNTVESKATMDGFVLTASMQDGSSPRRATYTVKLVGDELHVS